MGTRMNASEDALDTVLLRNEAAYKRMPLDDKAGVGLKLREYLGQSKLLLGDQITMESPIGATLLERAEQLLARKMVRGEATSEIQSALIAWLTNPETHCKWSHDSLLPRPGKDGLTPPEKPDHIYRRDGKTHLSGDRLDEGDVTHLVTTFTQLLKDTTLRDQAFRQLAGLGSGQGV